MLLTLPRETDWAVTSIITFPQQAVHPDFRGDTTAWNISISSVSGLAAAGQQYNPHLSQWGRFSSYTGSGSQVEALDLSHQGKCLPLLAVCGLSGTWTRACLSGWAGL